MVAGNTTERGEIRSSAPQIQTDTSEVARQYDLRVVRELPIQDRNIREFVGLMTGVTPPLPADDPPDKFKLEFRGEAYNLTNTPHFASQVADVSSLNFGRSTRLVPGYGPRT